MSYSKMMGTMAKKNILLNRKMLSDLAQNHPEAFKRVMDVVSK
jgi:large subunit ribosomal protein L20